MNTFSCGSIEIDFNKMKPLTTTSQIQRIVGKEDTFRTQKKQNKTQIFSFFFFFCCLLQLLVLGQSSLSLSVDSVM